MASPHPLELSEGVSCYIVDENDVIHQAEYAIRFESPKAVDADETPYVLRREDFAIAIEQ